MMQHSHSHTRQTAEKHAHAPTELHTSQYHGSRLMAVLGLVGNMIAHNSSWMSNYRTTKWVPASGKVIVGTMVVLLIGAALAHLLPPSLSGFGIGLIIIAAAHLAILLIGGLLLTLFIRYQRAQIRWTIINSIPWQGTEQVLDVGCGSGMLLTGCAQRLTTGHAIGIDLWQQPVAGTTSMLMTNAIAEGVADKITYHTMDARQLTFPNSTFDVVVSSLALHHIGNARPDREHALQEMIRVLAPRGYLALVDVGPMIAIAEDVITQAGLSITCRKKTSFVRFMVARQA